MHAAPNIPLDSPGVYTLNQSLFDPALLLVFGVIGYLMRSLGFNNLPMVLGVALGFMAETNFRRALVMSNSDYGALWGDPIRAFLLALSCALIAYPLPPLHAGLWPAQRLVGMALIAPMVKPPSTKRSCPVT